jgi:hypothetical protein
MIDILFNYRRFEIIQLRLIFESVISNIIIIIIIIIIIMSCILLRLYERTRDSNPCVFQNLSVGVFKSKVSLLLFKRLFFVLYWLGNTSDKCLPYGFYCRLQLNMSYLSNLTSFIGIQYEI